MDTKPKRKGKIQRGKITLINEELKKQYPDRMKFFGTVKLKFDPVAYQREERNEW